MAERELLEALGAEWEGLVARHAPPPRANPLHHPPHERAPVSPVALFAELEDVLLTWQELSLAVTRFTDRYVSSNWTVRELLAHIASWAREFRFEVETALRGGAFDYAIPFAFSVIGPNEWNQVEVDRRAHQPLSEILAEFEAETRRLQDLVLEASPQLLRREAAFPLAPSGDPAERLRGSTAHIILSKCMHDRYHIGQIRRWLTSVEKGA